ncbi:MAG TPA: hypothetical protein VNQ79_02270 [Blastocatellia bacterium]|nr:hypothetical protein [Blastocatellia bacterium]
MKRILSIMLLMIAAPSADRMCTILAQTPAPQPPPKVLNIGREEVKPNVDAEHAQVESAWARAFAKANWSANWLGMTSISGPPEAWFLTGYDSFAAFEKSNLEFEKRTALKAEDTHFRQLDKDLLRGSRGMLATFRDDLSYQPAVSLAQMRYFRVNMIRVRPGLNDDFIEYRKIIRAALEKAQSDTHFAIYQTVSGAPNGTFLIFTPMKSLAEMDPNPASQKAMQDALGSENQRKLSELTSKAILSNEPIHFALSPEMSYLSKEFIAADPAFWKPKPKPAAATKKPTETTKPGQ